MKLKEGLITASVAAALMTPTAFAQQERAEAMVEPERQEAEIPASRTPGGTALERDVEADDGIEPPRDTEANVSPTRRDQQRLGRARDAEDTSY